MIAKVKANYANHTTGFSEKTQKNYWFLRVRDDDNDSFANLFCEEKVFDKVDKLGLEKNQNLTLIIKISIGYKRNAIDLVDIEIA